VPTFDPEVIGNMRISSQSSLVLVLAAAAFLSEARARQPEPADRPALYVPSRPQTRQELAQREALRLYGLAVIRIYQDRLVDAASLLEEARTLDPEAAPLAKALVPIYLALSRTDDALQMSQKTLELDPGDYETWSILARQLKSRGKSREAQNALARALGCRGMADHPELCAQLSFDLGVSCEQSHDYERALAAFAEVVKILDDPEALPERQGYNRAELESQAAETYERMIKMCIEDRLYDRALELFGQGRKAHPALNSQLHYHLAKVQLAMGRPRAALDYLHVYLKTQPHGTEAYDLLIATLKDLRREDEILPEIKEYAERDVHNQALQLLLAREYAAAGRSELAQSVYSSLAEESPNAEVYRALFSLHRNDGHMERVLELLDGTFEKSTDHDKGAKGDPQAAAKARAMLAALREDTGLAKSLLPAAQARLVNGEHLHRQTLAFMAVLASRAHQLPAAEVFYRRCLEDLASPQQESAVYGGLMDVLWEAHKYEGLVEVCRRGLQHTQATNHLLFYDYLSRALTILGKIEEAVEAARKAVDIANEENRLWARRNYARVLTQAERFPEALAQCQAALKDFKDPGDARGIHYELSNVYTAMRDLPKAEEQLELILKSDPNDAGASNDLGYLWADQGKNLEEAETLIRKAIALDAEQKKGAAEPDQNAAYLDSLGWVLFRRGRLKEARVWLEKASALSVGDDDPVIWDHLGDVYFRLQETERARSAWQKAVSLYDIGRRRRDEHYKELKHKLQLEVDKQHP
jgi:tetratricopeptide (TPR) repeat protein